MLRLAICANASGSKPSQIPVVLAAGTLVLPDRRSNLPELDSLSALVALYGGRTFLKVVFCGSHKTGDVVRVGQSCGWLCHNMKQERGGLGSRSFRQYSVCGRYFNICEQWRNFDPSSPNFRPSGHVSMGSTDAESSNGRMRRSERLHVGSIPASAASQMEVIRPDEEPVLKTGGGQQPLVGSSPTASALRGHGPIGRRWLRKPEIRVRVPVTPLEWHSPVVQRQRHLVHIQETMVRLHPGLLDCPGTPIGRAAWLGTAAQRCPGGCGFDSGPGHGPVGKRQTTLA